MRKVLDCLIVLLVVGSFQFQKINCNKYNKINKYNRYGSYFYSKKNNTSYKHQSLMNKKRNKKRVISIIIPFLKKNKAFGPPFSP